MISVCKDLVSANDFLDTFFVITEPAPVYDPFPSFTGATKEELDPMNAPSSSLVLCLFFPS